MMAMTVFRTPFGWCAVAERKGRVVRVAFPCRTRTAAVRAVEPDAGDPSEFIEEVRDKLQRYFDGERVRLAVPVDLSGCPPFHRAVLQACREVQYGEVRTYGWLAHRVGRPRAARAVGQAMAHNPIPIIIPCHRIVAAHGRLGGYGGGVSVKRRLLEMEGGFTFERTLDL